MTKQKQYETDLTNGPIFKKLVIFALPLVFTNILQILFNAADVAVLGIFVGDDAVAAVGANTSLSHLIVNFFIGLAGGASVVLSKYVGAQNRERAKRIVGTSVVLGVTIGFIALVIGVLGARTFLTWMNCPLEILDKATTYLTIYCMGMPIILLYNFTAGILRAVGDTFRPMLFLLIGGTANVILNVFFVTVCNMTVEGVAIATVASQGISAFLCIVVMLKSDGYSKLLFKYLKIDKAELFEIIRIGVPTGIQACMFSISNVIIQTTINAYGDVGIAGNTISQQFEGIITMLGSSIALANMSFVSQNFGAQDKERIKKCILVAIAIIAVAVPIAGLMLYLVGEKLCYIMTDSAQVVEHALVRLNMFCATMAIGNIMDVVNYALRGLGRSATAMFVSIIFVCVFRIVWLNSVYLLNPTFAMIFYSYPVSWALCLITSGIYLISVIKKIKSKEQLNMEMSND